MKKILFYLFNIELIDSLFHFFLIYTHLLTMQAPIIDSESVFAEDYTFSKIFTSYQQRNGEFYQLVSASITIL